MGRTKRGTYRPKSGQTSIAKGPAAYVSIYCRGAVGHDHSKWRIGSLFASLHEGEIVWNESVSGYAETGSDTLVGISSRFTVWLNGDTYVPRSQRDAGLFQSASFRVVWDFLCPKCSFSARVSPPARAYLTLSALAELGIEEIGVREFIARVVAPPMT